MITIYGKPSCPSCTAAKMFLDSKNMPYDYKELDRDFVREDLVALAPNARTYPQVFIDGRNIGGYEQLVSHVRMYEQGSTPSSGQLLTED